MMRVTTSWTRPAPLYRQADSDEQADNTVTLATILQTRLGLYLYVLSLVWCECAMLPSCCDMSPLPSLLLGRLMEGPPSSFLRGGVDERSFPRSRLVPRSTFPRESSHVRGRRGVFPSPSIARCLGSFSRACRPHPYPVVALLSLCASSPALFGLLFVPRVVPLSVRLLVCMFL